MFNPAMFESMKHMMNGNMMKQGAEMMAKMSDEELKSLSSTTGMNFDPRLLRQTSASFAKMDESTLEGMKNRIPSNFPSNPTLVIPSPPASPAVVEQSSKALELKNQGTKQFKKGETAEAARLYRLGIQEIEKSALSEANKQLEVSLRMNLVACLAKEEKFEEIIEQCKKTLALENNTRALYRSGQALFRLGKTQEAVEYLKRAKDQAPGDDNITSLYEDARNALEKQLADNQESKNSKTPEAKKPEPPENNKPVIQNLPKNRGVDLDLPVPKASAKPAKVQKTTEKITEKEEKPVKTQPVPSPQPSLSTPNLSLPELSREQMNRGLEDLKNMSPEAISQMANQFKSMDPRLMQEVFKSQGINMPPEQIAKMADMLTPETINMMTSTMSARAGNPSPNNPPNQSTSPPGPEGMPNMSSMLNNPEMIRMASQMLSQQLGQKPEDIERVLSCFGKLLKLFGKFVGIYTFLMKGNRKFLTIGGVVCLFSMWMGYL